MSYMIIFILGSLLIAYGVYFYWYYHPSRWQQVKALVVASEAEIFPSRTGQLFAPRIHFEFLMDNKRFLGREYAFSSAEDVGSLSSVNGLLNSYRVGAHISVWCQIREPKNSCVKLMSSYSKSQMAAVTIGGLIINAFGIFLLVIGT